MHKCYIVVKKMVQMKVSKLSVTQKYFKSINANLLFFYSQLRTAFDILFKTITVTL